MVRVTDEVRRLRKRFEARAEESHVWEAVQLARHADRPYTLDYAERLTREEIRRWSDVLKSGVKIT